MRSLGSRMQDVDLEYYATVGYDSPWVQDNRRNEVWLVKKSGSEDYQSTQTNNLEAGNSDYVKNDYDLETVPYEVIESKEVSGLFWFQSL